MVGREWMEVGWMKEWNEFLTWVSEEQVGLGRGRLPIIIICFWSTSTMGWFGFNDDDSNDMTDDGKEGFVFHDDDDEETAEPIQQNKESSAVGGAPDDEEAMEEAAAADDVDPPKQETYELGDEEDKNMERAPASHRNPLYTCRRFWSELWCCQSWFHLSERVNQRELDIPESFAPFSIFAFLWKCILAGTCVGTLTYKFLESDDPEYVMAFLTQWAALASVLYSIMSVINTIFAARTPQPHAETVGFRIRLTWVLFELAVHLGACATLLFWVFLFNKNEHLEYLALALHGGLFLLVMFDGFYVNRIPLRWMHYFGIILPIEVLYGLWTYIHYVADIGNPGITDGKDGSDDALYPNVADWGDNWEKTLIYVLIIVLAVGPLLFCLLWCVSNGLCSCRDTRRYFDDPVYDEEGRPTVDDVQEGMLPCCVHFLRRSFLTVCFSRFHL